MTKRQKLAVGFMLCLITLTLSMLHNTRAYATLNLSPNPGTSIPVDPYNYFVNCDSGNQSPAFRQWVTSPTSPGTTTITIPEGTTTIPLRYTFAGVVCKSNSAVLNTRAAIISASPAGVAGVAGRVLDINFGASYRTKGTYRSQSLNFTYTASQPITRDFTIVLNTKIINHFSDDQYLCVPSPGGDRGSINNYGPCQTNNFPFTINVVVTKPPITVVCNITPASLLLGATYTPTVTLNHRGPTTAPNVAIRGSVTPGAFAAQSLSGTALSSGATLTLTGSPVTFGAAGTYNISASFTGTATGRTVTNPITCSRNITVTLPPPVVRCESQSKQALVGDAVGVDFTIVHDGPANSPIITFSATLLLDTKPSQSFSGSVNRFGSAARSGTAHVLASGVYRYTVTVATSPAVTVTPCTGTLTVLTGPYLRTYGNDVQTGGGFMTASGLCTTQTGQIITQNRGSAGSFAGSGSQLGAFARGSISGFRSASTRADAVSTPTALSFADRLVGALGFGGSYGANLCMVDQWSQGQAGVPVTTQSIDITTFGDGVNTTYVITPINSGQPVTIRGLMPNAKRLALYVKGNAVIVPNASGRFGYASTNWPTLNDIPSLYVVTLGNIGIANTATNIDGNYIAQPAVVGTGRITTCVNPATGALYDSAGLIANCNRQLIVNGSFSATHVNFLRTINTVGQALPSEPALASRAAEVLRYGMESIVARQAVPAKPSQTYDSITALPPSL